MNELATQPVWVIHVHMRMNWLHRLLGCDHTYIWRIIASERIAYAVLEDLRRDHPKGHYTMEKDVLYS